MTDYVRALTAMVLRERPLFTSSLVITVEHAAKAQQMSRLQENKYCRCRAGT
jgi:hypothetical protein